MSILRMTATGVTKEFNRRTIFRDVSISLSQGESLAITGRNGSGKSTLVKVVAGLLSATRGKVEYAVDGKPLEIENLRYHIGLVSPYLQLYDEFSGSENLELLSKIRSDVGIDSGRIQQVLETVGLWERRSDYVRTYSSGMKQRLKYAFAVLHRPSLLILDEPTSNLDHDGIAMVKKVVDEQKKQGVLIVATNDADEAGWCSANIELGKH
ncbi:MAG: ABC transporter ATP-binding protein [Ignavibacteriales bacterium]|nr:ABC transporter ATP-binding protein [Ignavibacteriales bacterium]